MCPSSEEMTVFMRHLVLVPQNMYSEEVNILRKIVHQVGFIYKISL